MFTFIFAILSTLVFVSAHGSSNDNLLKFTREATCDFSSNCTYSVVLSATVPSTSYNAKVLILIDFEIQNVTNVAVDYENPQIIDFNVKDKSEMNVIVIPDIDPAPFMLFRLYNRAGGKGKMLQDSKSREFVVSNICQGLGCVYNFYTFSVIPANVYAYFKINGTTVATLDTATTNLNIPVNIYDILSVAIEGDISISDSVMILIDYDSRQMAAWSSNGYYTPFVFPGICLPPIQSPFGGCLHQMDQEEIDRFLNSIGTSYSTLWYRETENNDIA